MTSMPLAKMSPLIPISYAESHAEKMKAAMELSRMFASSKTNTKTQGLRLSSKKGSKQKECHTTEFKQDEVDISKPIVYRIPSDVTAWLTGGSSSSTPSTPRLPISSKTTSAPVSIVFHSESKVHGPQTSIPDGSPRNIAQVRTACKGDMTSFHGHDIGLQPGRLQKPLLRIVDIEKAQDCHNLSSERPTVALKPKLEPDLIDISPLSTDQCQLSSTSDYLSDLRGLSFDGITGPGVSNTEKIEDRGPSEVKWKESLDIGGLSDSTQKTGTSAKPKTGLAASRWAD